MPQKRRWNVGRYSLKTQLGLVFGCIALVLAVAFVAIIERFVQPYVEQDQGQFLAELAYHMADKLDRTMFERYREIQIVARLDQFRNPEIPASVQQSVLEDLKQTYAGYAWIGFLDKFGIVQAATDGILEGADISHRPVFINTQGQSWLGDVHEALLLASLLPQTFTLDEPLRFVDVTAPVFDPNGEQIGVLAAHLDWKWAQEVKGILPASLNPDMHVETFIVSTDRKILASSSSSTDYPLTLDLESVNAAHQNQVGFYLESWFDGETYLTGFAPTRGYQAYPGLGWLILIRQDAEQAFAPAREMQQEAVTISLCLGIGLLVIGWMIARQLTDPILKLAEISEEFRQGNRIVKIPPIRGNSEVAVLARSFDKLLHERIEHERLLIALNDSLELRVQSRTQELHQMNQNLQQEAYERLQAERKLHELASVLQQSNEELEQFAYVASHDLQEPLRTVASYTQLLEHKYQEHLDEKAKKYIYYIVDGANRMQQLINDLLAYSKVGRQRLRLEPTDCHQVIHQVLVNLQGAIAEHQATITYETLPTVSADPLRLTQLFQNLIGNAIKYQSDQPPQVHISVEERSQDWLFSVCDNGIGIDPQYAERIFVIFQRLHTRRHYSGTGIGLAICKKIVDLHNGQIWVESLPHQGSTFYFTIPATGSSTTGHSTSG